MAIIAVDVDDVTFDLVGALIKRYNAEYNDKLKKEDITSWYLAQFVKEECGEKIYEYFQDPSIYNDIEIIENAWAGVKALEMLGNRVVFATHSSIGASGAKYEKLLRLGFLDRQEDYIEAKDKSLIRADYLIDDKPTNVENFKGVGIAFSQPWNKNLNFKVRVDNWENIIALFTVLREQEL